MTFSNRYRATLSGERRRWPFSVQVSPYSFSSPKILRFICPQRSTTPDRHDSKPRLSEHAFRPPAEPAQSKFLGEVSEGAVEAPSDEDGGRSPPPRLFGEELAEGLDRKSPELAAGFAAVEHGDFQIALAEGLVLRQGEGAHAQLDGLLQGHRLLEVILEIAADFVGLPAPGGVVPLVLDGAVVQDVVDLAARPLAGR